MIYSLLVTCSPDAGTAGLTAARFVETALAAGHEVKRVFFQDEGVYHGNRLRVVPQDELDITGLWRALRKNHDTDLVLCVASCLRRGLLDETESSRYEREAVSIDPAFRVGGLGELMEASAQSERFLTFGA